MAQRPLEHGGLVGQFMDRWTEPTLQHSIPRTNRLQRDKQCYLRGFLSKYVLIFSLKYGRNNLFNDLFLSAFILIRCHHARGFFSLFFCKRTEKEEFDLQTSAANFAALLLNFYCLNILSCFCFLQLGVFFLCSKTFPK